MNLSKARLGVWLLMVGCSAGCESSGSSSPGSGGSGGTPGTAGSGGSGGGAGGSESTGSGAATAAGGSAGQVGSAGSSGSPGSAGAAGAPQFGELGVCGRRGRASVDTEGFEGFEEYYLIGDQGFGSEICVVRVEVTRVGQAPGGCDQYAGQQEECLWTHLVSYSSPSVLVNEDGACADSQLGLDAAAIQALDGVQRAYGFVSEYQGHNSVLLQYEADRDVWEPAGNATWDEPSSSFRFDRRDGICGY